MGDGNLSPSGVLSTSPSNSLTSSDSFVSNYSDFSVDANSNGRGNQEDNKPLYGKETREFGAERTSGTSNGETKMSNLSGNELNVEIWEPPEVEDSEDDMEDSVANEDDEDDECGDGTEWSKPCSLSSYREEGSGSYKYKEEKQKAMEEVINGKFKVLVSQLLKAVGVDSSGKDGESWVDIVKSLSWEAASFVRPDAIDCKVMDPDGYVKVKCIATGSRDQSQVIKGLVFKKHTAHKHMPTTYKNPRLLLIRGMLGQSSSGLSSFDSMKQEKDYLKSIIEMIETCHPNVILVEKTVSRDIQECILDKGITLVFDMKLHRLERVARCTGSPILSPDTLMNQKLKHCDYFHIEKFVMEHAMVGEGGKKPSKTLMFLEGCPTRLGCTILLKGSHSNELKRIKCVVQCAVVLAYHLILETSFLVDQKAMFSTLPFSEVANGFPTDQHKFIGTNNSSVPGLEESITKSFPIFDIPISHEFHDAETHNLSLNLEDNASLPCEPNNPAILSKLSSFLDHMKKVLAEKFPLVSSTSYPSLSSHLGLNGKETDSQVTTTIPVLTSKETIDHCDMEAKGSHDEKKSNGSEQSEPLPTCYEASPDTGKIGSDEEEQVQSKDGISTMLESQSILVLMSSRNAFRGTICEQCHFSHIKFYKNFDVPLGKFLRDNMLNQRQTCSTCGELPAAHFYYYAHHNNQITIQVKQLSREKRLPGEAEGKLWMWSRCGKCKAGNGTSRSTKRVLLSAAARGLSFGKFLELSFSHRSSFSRLSTCGHSLHEDFFHFFGLGPMVAMFSYSTFATFTILMPPQKLEFNNSIRYEWLLKETENVYAKGMMLFAEVADSLQKLRSKFEGSTLKLNGSLKEFPDIEEMLNKEMSDFEVNIKNAVVKNGNHAVYKFLRLNRLLWELLLESHIWYQRLHLLLSPDSTIIDTTTSAKEMQDQLRNDTARGEIKGGDSILDNSDNALDNSASMNIEVETCVEADELPIKDTLVDGLVQEVRDQGDPAESEQIVRPAMGNLNSDISSNNDSQEENLSSDHLLADRNIPISSGIGDGDSVISLEESKVHSPADSLIPNLENSEERVWTSFPELRQGYMKELQGGFLPILESISSYSPEHLPSAYNLISEEGSRLHIPLGNDDCIVSDYEDELSSVIACALARLDLPVPLEHPDEDTKREKGMTAKTTSSSHSLPQLASVASAHWASTGSSDSDGLYLRSVSFEETRFSSFDGLNLFDSLVSFPSLHPEVSLGTAKLPGKSKYSVVCLYADRFRDLRNRCCPSEHAYIASLSRCRNWDAKGGKSKAVFAKSLDDRFIIKEIKKTESDSFMAFAPNYFKYMNQSFELGNQTCLAKILGVYQVRQAKSGKETKHLIVMENLSFGRNISRQYDLKGALHARFKSAGGGDGDVLLDQNFVNDMNASPLYVSNKAKQRLQRAVWNDTNFLNSINVMDYSLLVGVDIDSCELICGIIDYLRQYTWDKQLETWAKSSLVLPKNETPTVISPREYKKRFRKFMSAHFLSVPDNWCSQRSSNPCELCEVREEESSEAKSRKQGEQNDLSL